MTVKVNQLTTEQTTQSLPNHDSGKEDLLERFERITKDLAEIKVLIRRKKAREKAALEQSKKN